MTIKTFIKNFEKSCEHWTLKYFVCPILKALFVMGPTCYLAYAKDFNATKQWLTEHPYVFLTCSSWPVISMIFMTICKNVRDRVMQYPVTNIAALQRLFDIVNEVVGSKSGRFSKYAIDYLNHPNGQNVFNIITRPDDQIKLLVQAARKFFEAVRKTLDEEVRVVLAKMGEKHVENFVCSFPEDKPPAENPARYQYDRCAFSKAKKSNDIVIIPSIEDELKKLNKKKQRYLEIQGDPVKGSLLVYPIRHQGLKEVVYCLSIYNSSPNYFKDSPDIREYYKNFIMDIFGKRIELEHSLKLIKEKKDEQDRKSLNSTGR